MTDIEWTDATWREAPQKWCTRCKVMHGKPAFGLDSSRGDGLSASCLASRRVHVRAPRPPAKRHGWLKPARLRAVRNLGAAARQKTLFEGLAL